jgi:hypothetical protein
MSDIGRVVDELDMMEDFMTRMGEICYKGDREVYREHARIIADAREVIDQLRRDVDALERVRDGRAVKIFHRGVVMINFDWWRRLLEAEGKWRCVPEIEDLEKADAEALSVAAATSPPEGETRGEAAGWISIEDRLPDAAGYECLVCAVNENTHQTHVFTAFTGYGEPGWWTSNVDYMSRAKSPSDNRLHSALRVTHWMPLPEPPEGYKNEID